MLVSVTGASLVGMQDNFTAMDGGPAAREDAGAGGGAGAAAERDAAAELEAAGIPERLRPWLAARGVGALVVKMGIVFEELTAERAVATMPVEGNTQIAGILHGGAHAVLAETLGSFAASLHAGAGRHAVGVDLNATHHRAAVSGRVRGTCTALHLGRTLATHEIVITGEDGRRLCTARITNLLRDDPTGPGEDAQAGA
ncbi:Thioesterase [Sinomonas atrocyanea]|uniref:Thioesterase n=2 Tax=Sinomonas atrocyanea TaxID=37927 RepID=A0A126ZZK2_9MICC|nr:Thioesterase [Sinomonas atrocyanea]GEB62646.1 thioesterase [Sinomonas atrocyanea]GGG54456.1 thioesterase [Sinomonas atrocyanea]